MARADTNVQQYYISSLGLPSLERAVDLSLSLSLQEKEQIMFNKLWLIRRIDILDRVYSSRILPFALNDT